MRYGTFICEQLGDDRAAVLVGQVGVEHLVVAVRFHAVIANTTPASAATPISALILLRSRHRLDAAGERRGTASEALGVSGDGVVHGGDRVQPGAKARRV